MKDHRRPTREPSQGEDPFLSRWSRRKLEQEKDRGDPLPETPASGTPEAPSLSDDDMPPLESLGPDSDYSGFLSPGVSESLRRLALRRLFHAPEFNLCDGLDDYDDDFRAFAGLGSVVPVEMRKRLEGLLEEKDPATADALAAAPEKAQTPDEAQPQEPEATDEEEELG